MNDPASRIDRPAAPAPTCVPLADLSIGSVHIGFPVVQAALSGYSDAPMRVTAHDSARPTRCAR